MIWILLVAILVLVHLLHLVWNRDFYKLKLPGPVALPFIGNAYLFLGRSNEAVLNVLTLLVTKWPTPVRFWLGPRFCVVANKPEDVQIVLNSPHCLDHAFIYDFLRPFSGEGLLDLKGMSDEG